jgi:hypothetical protein
MMSSDNYETINIFSKLEITLEEKTELGKDGLISFETQEIPLRSSP